MSLSVGAPSLTGATDTDEPPATALVTGGEDQLLACPATESAALCKDNQFDIQRETTLDGSSVVVRESSTDREQPRSYDPDLITVTTLVDVLLTAVGVERAAPDSASLAMDLVRDVYRSALAVPAGRLATAPVAGVDATGALTTLLRDANGVSRAGPPTWDEAGQLCDQIVQRTLTSLELNRDALTWLVGTQPPGKSDDDTPDPEEGGPIQQAADECWNENDDNAADPATFESEPDPPATDPWAPYRTDTSPGTSIAALAVPTNLFRILTRPIGKLNYQRLLKYGLPRESRRKLRAWVRERERSGEIQAHSSEDGKEAEKALFSLYLLARGRHAEEVLNSTRVGGKTLKAAATAGSVWETVRTALTSFLLPPKAMFPSVARPDILDPALREVYEIKPKGDAVDGAEQLYGRYLLFLNAWECYSTITGTTARRAIIMAVRVVAKFTCYVGEHAPSNVDLSDIGTASFWTPGSWIPPRRVLTWTMRLMDVEVPIPGLLCYQMKGDDEKKREQAKPVEISAVALALLGLVIARALADAANNTKGAPEVEALARAAGDSKADGKDIAQWLAGAAVGTAAVTAGAAKLAETLARVATWFGVLAEDVALGAAPMVPLPIPRDPETGMPYGLTTRYGVPPIG